MATSTILYRVFVYGTLKRGFPNHDRFCRGIPIIEEGMVRGRLYALTATIPALEIPAEDILAVGTRDYQQDAKTLADVQIERTPTSSDGESADWRMIRGEVLTFPESERLARLDQLEGFHPPGPCLYHRVLAPVRLQDGDWLTAWVYVMGDRGRRCVEPVDSENWEQSAEPCPMRATR